MMLMPLIKKWMAKKYMSIVSRPSTPAYRENFDKVFSKKKDWPMPYDPDEKKTCPPDMTDCFFIGTDREYPNCPGRKS